MFKGKEISNMTRDELLDFAEWAGHEVFRLQKIADSHYELDLRKEVLTRSI